MLARMIIAGQSLRRDSTGPADFIVTSDAEWNAVFANSAAALAGKIIEIRGSNFTRRTIANKDMIAAGAQLTIRCADSAAQLPAIIFNGIVRGIDFSGLNLQMTGWPRDYGACITFNNGTFDKLRFINGCTFRHGYGPSLAPIPTGSELPEYERISHVQTATTTSTTYPLTWKDTAISGGMIEFFNRGTQTVRVAVGGAGVVATTASTACAGGQRVRITGISPATATHFAVMSTSGSSEVNARTEQGIGAYLADTFASSGAANIEDLEFRNCLFRDFSNAMKNIFKPQSLIVMDCDFDRIYQDIIAAGPRPGGVAYFLRNVESLPFARSGIPEQWNGDAGDPHGDQYQMFSDSQGTIGPIFYAGNRIRPGALRSDATSQGVLVADNGVVPSYSGLYFISTMFIGGAPIGIALGSTSFPVADSMIYGASVFDYRNPASTLPRVGINATPDGSVYVGKTITADFAVSAGTAVSEDVLLLRNLAAPAAVFPNLATLQTAADRAEIETALTSAAEGAGLGAVATRDAVDWETNDPSSVIRWENLPSGVHWPREIQQPLDTTIVLPLRKVLNRRPGQSVSVAPGTQWRKLDTDKTTELLDWTSAPGTIEPDQFIQIRRTSSDEGGQTVTASVAINGFTQNVDIITANIPGVYLVQAATPGRYIDPVNLAAGTTRITCRGKFFWPNGTMGNGQKPWALAGLSCDLETLTNGWRVSVRDGTGASMYVGAPHRHVGSLVPEQWLEIELDVDHAAAHAVLTINGISQTYPFDNPTNGVFLSNARLGLIGAPNLGNNLPGGVRFANLSVDVNGVRYKTFSNAAATANADPWKQGSDFING